jgi:hypothetical protein
VAKIRESFEGSRFRDDPSTTGISAVDIGCEIGRLVDASMASNTKDTYKVGLDSFQDDLNVFDFQRPNFMISSLLMF